MVRFKLTAHALSLSGDALESHHARVAEREMEELRNGGWLLASSDFQLRSVVCLWVRYDDGGGAGVEVPLGFKVV
jgi:hypothetical protein